MEPLYYLLEGIFWVVLGAFVLMVVLMVALMIGGVIALIVCGVRAIRQQKRRLREAEEDLDDERIEE